MKLRRRHPVPQVSRSLSGTVARPMGEEIKPVATYHPRVFKRTRNGPVLAKILLKRILRHARSGTGRGVVRVTALMDGTKDSHTITIDGARREAL